jgi:phage recombination protein Bet
MKAIQKSNQTPIDVEKLQTYLNAMGMGNNLNSNEFQQFVEIAQSFGLNPFKREIYASKYGDQFSVIVGFETYIKRAERSGLLSGWHVETFGTVDWKNIENSTLMARIKIHRKDFEHPFIHDVYFIEYVGRRRDGQPTKFWKEKPITMTKKVAMAQGFRLCFSDELGGMPYTREEMNAMDVEHVVVDTKITIQPVDEPIGPIISKVMAAETIDQLIEIWKSNEKFQGNPEFKHSMSKRKIEIKAQNDAVDESKHEKHVDMLIRIQNATTCDEIIDLTIDETEPAILMAANDRMNFISENE